MSTEEAWPLDRVPVLEDRLAASAALAQRRQLLCGLLMERHRIGVGQAEALLDEVVLASDVHPDVLAEALLTLLGPRSSQLARPGPLPASGLPRDDGPGPDRSAPTPGGRGEPAADASTAAAWRALEELPRLEASAVQTAVSAVAAANEDGRAAAQLVADLAGAQPDRAVLYAVAGDAALSLVGYVGTPDHVAATWAAVPLTLDIPLCASVTQDRPFFLESAAELESAFPATRGSGHAAGAWASVPVRDAGRVIGVVGFSWERPRALAAAVRTRIVRAVDRAGPSMVRGLREPDPGVEALTDLMHLIPGMWIVLAPGSGEAGDAVVVDAACPALCSQGIAPSMPLEVAFPPPQALRQTIKDLLQVHRSGQPLMRTVTAPAPDGPPWEREPGEIRIVRAGRRCVLTWRPTGQR